MNTLNLPHISKCLSQSVIHALSVQLSMTPTLQKATEEVVENCLDVDCLSTIVLNSSMWTGTLSLAFPQQTILKIIENMLGEVYTELNSENADTAGELLNIIYGNARMTINGDGYDFQPALPTTVAGKELGLAKHKMSSAHMVHVYESEAGPFMTILWLCSKAA